MIQVGFEAMLIRAAELVAAHSRGGGAHGVWLDRKAAYALSGRASIETLAAAIGRPRRARLTWRFRHIVCRRLPVSGSEDFAAVGNRAKQTIVALSPSAGVGLKLSWGHDAAAMLAMEIATLRTPAVAGNGLAPRVLDQHIGAEECWLLLEYCRPAQLAGPALAEGMRRDLLPRLLDSWAAAGPEMVRASDIRSRISAAVARNGLSRQLGPALARLEALYEDVGDFTSLAVMTHGDLQPRHVMRGPDGRLLCIDWDIAARRLWTADFQRLAKPHAMFVPQWRNSEAFLAADWRGLFEEAWRWTLGAGADDAGAAGRAFLVLAAQVERILEVVEVRQIPFARQDRTTETLTALGLNPDAPGESPGPQSR